MQNQDNWFPKDCRSSGGKTHILSKALQSIAVLLIILCVAGLVVFDINGALCAWLFVIAMGLLSVGIIIYRCPACGAAFDSRDSGFCAYCGSQTSDGLASPNNIKSMLAVSFSQAKNVPPPSIKILESSSEHLRFRFKRASGLGCVLFILGIGLWMLLGAPILVECKRLDGGRVDCQSYSTAFGSQFFTKSFNDVRQVEIEYNYSRSYKDHRETGIVYNSNTGYTYYDKARTPTSRIIFVTANGRIPLTRSFSRVAGSSFHENFADEINRFLNDASKSKAILRQDTPFLAWPLSGILCLIAFWLLFVPLDEFHLDRNERLLRILRRGWINSREQNYPLDIIVQFGVIRSTHFSNNTNKSSGNSYCIGARLATGALLQLETSSSLRYEWRRDAASYLEKLRISFTSQPVVVSASSQTPPQSASTAEKVCVVCQRDCGNEPRYKDEAGHYYHQNCYR